MASKLGLGAVSVATVVVLGGLLILSGTARSDDRDKAPVTAKTAFEQLKHQVGTWKNNESDKEHQTGADSKVTFRLTGAGSALVETDLPGSDHEMVSVYHLDHEDLRLTHYCAAGNQPRLKLDRPNSTPTRLVFVFDGGSNLDPDKDMHIHGMTLTFEKEGEVKAAWEGYQGGKSAGTTIFHLTREKP
jgi:hypothetical protein